MAYRHIRDVGMKFQEHVHYMAVLFCCNIAPSLALIPLVIYATTPSGRRARGAWAATGVPGRPDHHRLPLEPNDPLSPDARPRRRNGTRSASPRSASRGWSSPPAHRCCSVCRVATGRRASRPHTADRRLGEIRRQSGSVPSSALRRRRTSAIAEARPVEGSPLAREVTRGDPGSERDRRGWWRPVVRVKVRA
jgi:hypothetical protein